MGWALVCGVCGWSGDFVAAVYASNAGTAPALECTRCRALILHEDAARNDHERESVKLAKAVRSAICEVAEPNGSGRDPS
jgi:hypothetical protein